MTSLGGPTLLQGLFARVGKAPTSWIPAMAITTQIGLIGRSVARQQLGPALSSLITAPGNQEMPTSPGYRAKSIAKSDVPLPGAPYSAWYAKAHLSPLLPR